MMTPDRREAILGAIGAFALIVIVFAVFKTPKIRGTYIGLAVASVAFAVCFVASRDKKLFLIAVPLVVLMRFILGAAMRLPHLLHR